MKFVVNAVNETFKYIGFMLHLNNQSISVHAQDCNCHILHCILSLMSLFPYVVWTLM